MVDRHQAHQDGGSGERDAAGSPHDELVLKPAAGKLADKTQMAGRFGLPFSLKISNFA